MSHDLRRSLTDLARAGSAETTPPAEVVRTTSAIVERRHRRRPAVVAGVTAASLALTATGAYAAVQIFGDHGTETTPDAIGAPYTTPPADPRATADPSAPVEPSPSPTPDEPAAPEPPAAPVQVPGQLPQADPTAVYPACGALVDVPSGRPDMMVGESWDDWVDDSVSIHSIFDNAGGARGTVSTHVTAVAVKDGVVVGWTEQDPPESTVFYEMMPGSEVPGMMSGPVAHTVCTDGETPLPPGRYAVWASQEMTVTEVFPWDDPAAVETLDPPTTVEVPSAVASLWIGEDGEPMPSPGLADGWPAEKPQIEWFDDGPPETVVWIAASAREFHKDFEPSFYTPQQQLWDLGYDAPEIPLKCQLGAAAQLGIDPAAAELDTRGGGSGVGLVFATRAEADTFVAQWEPLHGPVLGVITLDVACLFS